MHKTFSNPPTVGQPVAWYSQAVRTDLKEGALIFVCGQLPLDAKGNLVGEGDIAEQADQVFRNIEAVLVANGAAMDDVVQTTTFITEMSGLGKVNEVHARYFAAETAPTSSTVEVSALARLGWFVEIEAIAAV